MSSTSVLTTRRSSGTELDRSPRSQAFLERLSLPFVLFAVAAAYAPALFGPFVLDDRLLVTENPRFADFRSVLGFFVEPVTAYLPGGVENIYYRPFSFLSLWIDQWLWGDRSFGFHLTSLLLHLGCCSILHRLVRRWWGSASVALLVAGIWALLPIHSEAVGYIAARHDTLFLFFYLLALDVYTGGEGVARKAIFFALAVASFLSKEMAISLPVAAMLFDALLRCPTTSWKRRAVSLAWPLVTLAVLFGIRLAVTSTSSPASSATAEATGTQPLLVASVVWHYVTVLATPLSYSIDRSHDVAVDGLRAAAGLGVVGAGIGGLLWLSRRGDTNHRRVVFLSIAWAGFAYLPVSNLVPLYTPCADRYLYLPLLPIVLALVATLCVLQAGRVAARRPWLLIATILIGLTISRSGAFTDERRLYEASLEASPRSPMVHNNLGLILRDRGAVQEADEHFRRALELAPHYGEARFNRGVLARERGALGLAESELAELVTSQPGHAEGWFQWGLAALAAARFEAARERLDMADHLEPHDLAIRYHLAVVRIRLGNPGEARRILTDLHRRYPDHAPTRAVLESLGDLGE